MLVNFGELSIHYNIPPDKLAREFSRYDAEDKAKFFNCLTNYGEPSGLTSEVIHVSKQLRSDARFLLVQWGESAHDGLKQQGDL